MSYIAYRHLLTHGPKYGKWRKRLPSDKVTEVQSTELDVRMGTLLRRNAVNSDKKKTE